MLRIVFPCILFEFLLGKSNFDGLNPLALKDVLLCFKRCVLFVLEDNLLYYYTIIHVHMNCFLFQYGLCSCHLTEN